MGKTHLDPAVSAEGAVKVPVAGVPETKAGQETLWQNKIEL